VIAHPRRLTRLLAWAIRMAERLSEGGVFTEDQAKRIATTLADHLNDEARAQRLAGNQT
jgi:hypothetical protein